jgi:hypothetical protein
VKRVLVLASLCALGLGGCGGGSGGAGLTSGIQGVVQAGPTCPVEQVGSPCPDRPVPSTVRAIGTDGHIAEGKTDDQGRFRMALEPGTYIVSAAPVVGAMTPSPVTVEVRAGAYARVTLEADTGIR